jgi:2-oxoglutarate dehydrogenase E1 component
LGSFFEGFELGFAKSEENGEGVATEAVPATAGGGNLQTRVEALVYLHRTLGHTIADLDPLDLLKRSSPLLTLKELGIDERLDLVVSSRFFQEGRKMKLREMIRELEAIYCGTVGAEFAHPEPAHAHMGPAQA